MNSNLLVDSQMQLQIDFWNIEPFSHILDQRAGSNNYVINVILGGMLCLV